MESIFYLAFTEADGSLSPAALEGLRGCSGLATALGTGGFAVGLIGDKTDAAVFQLGGCGASRCLAVSGPAFSQARYATDALAAETLIRKSGATLVLACCGTRTHRVLPGVADRLQGRADTHVTGVVAKDGGLAATRWFYRQRMEGTFCREHRPWVLLVEPGCAFEPASSSAGGGAPNVERVNVEVPAALQRTKVTGRQSPPSDQQTIRPESELLFVVGAGWTKKQADGQAHVPEAEKLILRFLGTSRASLGSSKSLVDISGEGQAVLSFLTHLNQVGQTGATPRHPKGLSTCCHGEEPHAVGWRFIRERRAVNLDPNCGWARGKADVLYVGDAFAVMEKVNALLGG